MAEQAEQIGATLEAVVTAAAVKPGVFTSEFVLSIMPWLAMFGVFVLVGVGRIDTEQAMLMITALGLGGSYTSGRYTQSRTVVKSGVVV